MSPVTLIPAGTPEARVGGNFTRVNCHGGPASDADKALFVLVDGRYIADVFEAVPGSWSTTGVAGHRTGFASVVDAEDAVIAAYHQLPVRADYEIDVHDGGDWRTVLTGRVGVAVDRLSALGVKAREIAAEYHTLRNLPVRVTLWSTTAPTSRVTTYAEYRQEEPMSEQPGHPGHPDQPTGDHPAPAGEAVTPPPAIDWSPLREGDRVWRADPVTGHPDGLTIYAVSGVTVTGQLDSGPLVTLPRTDICGVADWPAPAVLPWEPPPLADALALMAVAGRIARTAKGRIESGEVQIGVHLDGSPATTRLVQDEAWKPFEDPDLSARKSLAMLPELLAAAADPNVELHVIDPKPGSQAQAWRKRLEKRVDPPRDDDFRWPDPDARPTW